MRVTDWAKRATGGRTVRNVLAGLGIAVLMGSNVGAGCGNSNKSSTIDVPLEYHPRAADATPMVRIPNGSGVKILVTPAEDKRDEAEKRVIGHNTEDSNNRVPVYASGRTVSDFVAIVLRRQLSDAGLNVTEDMANATRTLASEVRTFEVTEGGSYKGEVRLAFKLVDPTGKVLFEQGYSGSGSNYGQSRSATNYQETFSDAVKEATNRLLGDPGFQAALRGQE